jgi:trimethylamine:corrinoid methyltransferase-like protein
MNATSAPAVGAGGAPAQRSRRRPPPDRSLRYRHLENPFEPLRVFSDDQVAAIHDAALRCSKTRA